MADEHDVGDRGVPCPLFWMALASAAGILLGHIKAVPPIAWVVFFLPAAGLAWVAGKRWRVVALWMAVGAASALWFQARALSLPPAHLFHQVGLTPTEARLRIEVAEDPVERRARGGGDSTRWEFRARVVGINQSGQWRETDGWVQVRFENPSDPDPAYGDVIEGSGYLAPPRVTMNPGQFDYAAWLRSRGVLYQFYLHGPDAVAVEHGRGSWLLHRAVAFKRHMRRLLNLGLEDRPEPAGLLSAMLFGYRDGMAEPVEEAFRVTGTMHLFAVSGQNVGIILGMLVLVLRTAGLIRWRWSWLVLPLLLLFCLSTGMQPSAFRAFVMAGLVSVGWALYRPVGLFNILGAAALFMFVWDPRILTDLGFQLSFVVLLGLSLLAPPLLRCWVRWGAPDPWIPRRLLPAWRLRVESAWRAVGTVVAVSLAAWLASLPHSIGCFHLFAPVALLANILVVPLAGVVLVLGSVSVAVGSVWGALALLPNLCSARILEFMASAITFLAGVPGGHGFVVLPWDRPPAGAVVMTVLHDGPAAPVVVQAEGRALLLDPGPERTWEYLVDSFRRWQGINEWEAVVLGHGGARRMGSATQILAGVPVREWVDSGWRSRSGVQHRWLAALQEQGKGKRFWRRGDRFSWPGGWTIEVLWPGSEMDLERLEDRGLVFRASGPGGAVLFAGDISAEVERRLLAAGAGLRADVLLQGEHSAGLNLSSAWLEAVRPSVLIRPGRGYQPDHSLDDHFWRDVERLGVRVLQQDDCGAVELRFRPEGLETVPFRSASD
ncbi:MAG: ComEC/Rec2 family competence protein [Candidatus Methylacidiphilales bacterium]|nr:ComEC/Rec2 family competence protein [Candidatus Methylacidiphilales bacterium]